MQIEELNLAGERPKLVFTDSQGEIIPDTAAAVRALRALLGHKRAGDLAVALKFISTRTIQGWEQGRPPSYAGMLQMQRLLTAHHRKATRK